MRAQAHAYVDMRVTSYGETECWYKMMCTWVLMKEAQDFVPASGARYAASQRSGRPAGGVRNYHCAYQAARPLFPTAAAAAASFATASPSSFRLASSISSCNRGTAKICRCVCMATRSEYVAFDQGSAFISS